MDDQSTGLPIIVKIKRYVLTRDDLEEAAKAGSARQIDNLLADNRNRWNPEGGPFQVHIEGAMGELACSRMIGLPWNGKGSPKQADVGRDIEVRTSGYDGKNPYLTIKEKDKDWERACFIRGANGIYQFGGWIHVGDAKKDKWTAKPDNYGNKRWFVPMEELQQ